MKKPKKSTLKNKLDKKVGELCRAKGYCEKCGSQSEIQWCHVSTRRYLITRWDEDNYIAQCATCHRFQGDHPAAWGEWFNDKFPGRMNRIMKKINSGVTVDVNWMIKFYAELEK